MKNIIKRFKNRKEKKELLQRLGQLKALVRFDLDCLKGYNMDKPMNDEKRRHMEHLREHTYETLDEIRAIEARLKEL